MERPLARYRAAAVAALLAWSGVEPLAASAALQAKPPEAPSPTPTPVAPPKPPPEFVAVIVHKDNPTSDVSLDQLRQLMRLDRQFWDETTRVVLVARPATVPEQQSVLKRVYELDDKALRKFLVGRLYAGQISALPTVVKSCPAAAKLVQQTPGAIGVVLATEVPAGVKVLRIDGKLPGETGYALPASE